MNEETSRGSVGLRKRACRLCADPELPLDYKEPRTLQPFITDRGKIIPRRVTGSCAFHQRRIQEAIKRARVLALIPFTSGLQGFN